MSLINVSDADGGLRKTSGCDGCPDAGAVSEQQVAGSGTLQFTAPESGSLRFVGLGSGGIGGGAGDISFALRLQGGVAEVREWGAYKTELPFAPGDTFTISVAGGVVQYAKNGGAFYTSAAQALSPLRVHVVLLNANAAVGSILLSSTASALAAAAEWPASPAEPSATAGPADFVDGSPDSADALVSARGPAVSPGARTCATPRLWIRLCSPS